MPAGAGEPGATPLEAEGDTIDHDSPSVLSISAPGDGPAEEAGALQTRGPWGPGGVPTQAAEEAMSPRFAEPEVVLPVIPILAAAAHEAEAGAGDGSTSAWSEDSDSD